MIEIGICFSLLATIRLIREKNFLYLPIGIAFMTFFVMGYNANLELAITMLANQEQLSASIATKVTNDAVLWLVLSALILVIRNKFDYFYIILLLFLVLPCLYNYDYFNSLFNLCCGVMCVFSIFTHISYLDSCTLVNIYGQAGIVFLGVILLAFKSYTVLKKKETITFWGLCSLFHIVITCYCLYRMIYPFIGLSLKEAAQLCVKLLYDYSITVTYNELNIFIFVICFLSNLIISRFLYKKFKQFPLQNLSGSIKIEVVGLDLCSRQVNKKEGELSMF